MNARDDGGRARWRARTDEVRRVDAREAEANAVGRRELELSELLCARVFVRNGTRCDAMRCARCAVTDGSPRARPSPARAVRIVRAGSRSSLGR